MTDAAQPPTGHVLVDAMNVIGSRPDGWWRDRPAAMARLVADTDAWCARTGAQATVVLDGRPFAIDPPTHAHVVFADGPDPGRRDAADDTIVRLAHEAPDPRALTVATSDGGLRARLPDGVQTIGARTFRALLDDEA